MAPSNLPQHRTREYLPRACCESPFVLHDMYCIIVSKSYSAIGAVEKFNLVPGSSIEPFNKRILRDEYLFSNGKLIIMKDTCDRSVAIAV